MNAVTQSTNADLHSAFKQFNKISEQFTFAYRDLETRFKQLKRELSDTKSKRLSELAEKEQLATRLHLLLTVLPMGVLVVGNDGNILESNQAAEDLLATPLRGSEWSTVLQQVFPDYGQRDISNICVNGRNLHLTSKSIPGSNDTLVLVNDVTDPIAHVDSVKRQERLAFLGNAIASIAHDIRTPLAASFLQLSNLDKKLKDKNLTAPAIESIRHSLKTLESTLNNMLMYAKGNADTYEAISCKKFSETVVNDVLEYFPGIAVSMRSDNELENKYIKINQNAIIKSIRNLISNAQQVTPEELEINVDMSVDVNNRLNIRVDDNGPGIEESIMEQIFEPFFTTKKNGTGLGLSIVKSIIDSHKGAVSVRNHTDGASFAIQIPLVDEVQCSEVKEMDAVE